MDLRAVGGGGADEEDLGMGADIGGGSGIGADLGLAFGVGVDLGAVGGGGADFGEDWRDLNLLHASFDSSSDNPGTYRNP